MIELTNAIISCHNYVTILRHGCLLQEAPFRFLAKEVFIKKSYYFELTPTSEKVEMNPIQRTNLEDASASSIDICSSLEN